MTKTLTTLSGMVYVLMGIAGLFDTALVGTNGFFAADSAYSFAFMSIGAVLLFGVLFRREASRRITLTVGVLLAVIGLSGFLIAPERGEMLGMLVNSADHWLNFLLGITLAGTALLAQGRREVRSLKSMRYMRHAVQ